MNLEEFMKEALKHHPAKIEATVDEKMESKLNLEGRPIELVLLSLSIVLEICDKAHLSISSYCDLLQKAAAHEARLKDIPKEQKDVELEIAKKIFESVFK